VLIMHRFAEVVNKVEISSPEVVFVSSLGKVLDE
jgi:hypothetical protein